MRNGTKAGETLPPADTGGDSGPPPGFTLIELMIVVAIIGILASIAVPKFAELIRKSNEGANKGNLGALRSALTIYYGDMEGLYPSKNRLQYSGLDPLVPKYIGEIPTVKLSPYHATVNTVRSHETTSGHVHDYGYWGYDGVYSGAANTPDGDIGKVWVACTHTDTRGRVWSEY